MSNILYKSLCVGPGCFSYQLLNIYSRESIFGYITVLPGAFSAYRYEALLGSPLDTYFKFDESVPKPSNPSQSEEPKRAGIFDANMYLAEDRVSLQTFRPQTSLIQFRFFAGSLYQRLRKTIYCNMSNLRMLSRTYLMQYVPH